MEQIKFDRMNLFLKLNIILQDSKWKQNSKI